MLATSRWVLRALLVLNVVIGIPLLLMLGWSFLDEGRFLTAAARPFPGADIDKLVSGARWSLALVAPVMVFAHLLLRALLRVLDSVGAGDPFVPDNADRLRTVAWCLLGIQLCDIGFGLASISMDAAVGERISGWAPGLTGWIAVILVFVLARVFREGTRLRGEAELTI